MLSDITFLFMILFGFWVLTIHMCVCVVYVFSVTLGFHLTITETILYFILFFIPYVNNLLNLHQHIFITFTLT